MRRPSSLKSQPFSQSTLHPVLQAMLGNLDVQLDEELARYRRQNGRRGGQPGFPRQSHPSPIQDTPPPAAEQTTAPTQTAYRDAGLGGAGLPLAIASDLDPSPSTLATLNVQPQTADELARHSADLSADVSAKSEDAWGPDAYLESSEHLLHSLGDEAVELRASQESGMLQSLLTPLGIGSMLLLLLSSLTFGYLLMNPSSMSFLGLGANQQTPAPNLAPGGEVAGTAGVTNAATGQDLSPNLSAQEFPDVNLDTLSTLPKTTTTDPASPAFTGLSPSGTGSAVAPSPGTELGVPSILSASPATTSAPASTNSAPNSARTSQSTASTLSPSPRSSSNTDTPSQRTRPRGTTVPASPARPATSSTTASSRRPAASATSRRSPSPPAASPQPRPQSPTPTVATAPRAPVVAPSPRSSTPASTAPSTAAPVYFYVVMDFSGDRSLERARQVVGDAFLRNFSDGAKIQFGRFVDRERAIALTRDLQSQGVSARVYQP